MRRFLLESESDHHHLIEWFTFRRADRVLTICGWAATGTPWDTITNGMTAIGLGHHTQELAGLRRGTMGNNIMRVTGMEITAARTTITGGITITTATTIITKITIKDKAPS